MIIMQQTQRLYYLVNCVICNNIKKKEKCKDNTFKVCGRIYNRIENCTIYFRALVCTKTISVHQYYMQFATNVRIYQ